VSTDLRAAGSVLGVVQLSRRRRPDSSGGSAPVSQRRAVVRSLVRSTVMTVVVFALYFTLPFDDESPFGTATALLAGLVAVAVLLLWQFREITRSPFPRLRALEGLVTTFPIVVLLFATTYFVMDEHLTSNFSEPLTRMDALYFTVTVFATVGFGDITPVTENARALVTLQMVVDLVLIGLVARAFVASVQTNLARRDNGSRPD